MTITWTRSHTMTSSTESSSFSPMQVMCGREIMRITKCLCYSIMEIAMSLNVEIKRRSGSISTSSGTCIVTCIRQILSADWQSTFLVNNFYLHSLPLHLILSDNERSLPHFLDGLKPSQRKVLFACFKRNLRQEIKVAQLAGNVRTYSEV